MLADMGLGLRSFDDKGSDPDATVAMQWRGPDWFVRSMTWAMVTAFRCSHNRSSPRVNFCTRKQGTETHTRSTTTPATARSGQRGNSSDLHPLDSEL